jgi:hypothetical protein
MMKSVTSMESGWKGVCACARAKIRGGRKIRALTRKWGCLQGIEGSSPVDYLAKGSRDDD